jgi:hypothetical protein
MFAYTQNNKEPQNLEKITSAKKKKKKKAAQLQSSRHSSLPPPPPPPLPFPFIPAHNTPQTHTQKITFFVSSYLDDSRNDTRKFNQERNGSYKVTQKLQQRVPLHFCQLVGPKRIHPLRRLLTRQTRLWVRQQ